jgi:hypothetical protein
MASVIAPIWTGKISDLPELFPLGGEKKEDLIDKIIRRKFVILEGVPGTGKTHIFKEMKGISQLRDFSPSTLLLIIHHLLEGSGPERRMTNSFLIRQKDIY